MFFSSQLARFGGSFLLIAWRDCATIRCFLGNWLDNVMKRFVCAVGKFGTFSVIDLMTGHPADAGATSIFLTRLEALRLAGRLEQERGFSRNAAIHQGMMSKDASVSLAARECR